MATLLQDAFLEGSDVNLASHTMDVGGGWTSFSGTWTVVAASDKAQPPSSQANSGAYADAGTVDVVAAIDLNALTASNNAIGLWIRVVDASNGWIVVLESDDTGNAFYLALLERNAGSNTVRGSAPAVHIGVATVVSTLTVTTSGDNIDAVLSGAFTGSPVSLTQWTTAHANSSVNSSTKFGPYAFTGSGYAQTLFDNFLVTGTAGGGGRTSKNIRAWPLGMAHGMHIGEPGVCSSPMLRHGSGLWVPERMAA